MSGIVQARLPDLGVFKQCLPLVMICPWVDRPAGRLGEDPTAFLPRSSRAPTLRVLHGSVLDQVTKQRFWDSYRTSPGS